MISVIIMDFDVFMKIITTDFNINKIFACPVKATFRYSCMEIPRKSDALFMIGGIPAVYEYADKEKFYAQPGDVLFLPKGARYTRFVSHTSDSSEHIEYLINFQITDSMGNYIPLFDKIVKLSGYDENFKRIFQSVVACYRKSDIMGMKAKLYELFGSIFSSNIAEDECCLDYIRRHYTNNLLIPELARRCAMSETAYRKKFKELTGKSPVKYINHIKIAKSCELLTDGKLSIEYISDFLGFYNTPYFYKIFKSVMGMTPLEYKKTKKEEKS